MTGTAYNGLHERHLHQINRQDGTPCVAYSAPDFFVTEPSMFAPKRNGNQVRFFTTGEDYFKDVADAILGAKTSIFITGWQINYDVLLDGKKTLWQCLHQALTANPELKVYVMPWLSPSASVMNTYDFETMLAVFQLNAGLENGPRAFCTPAIQQSDMSGLGATFSHHQKSVVIDNRIGYVGGIDLAYGRCDNNDYNLDASKRLGNDAYNPCIPPLGWMPQQKHVSKNGLLLAALFDLSKPVQFPRPPLQVDGADWVVDTINRHAPLPSRASLLNSFNYLTNFINSPPPELLQAAARRLESVGQVVEQGRRNLVDLKMAVLERMVRATAELIEADLGNLDPKLQQRLRHWLEQLKSAQQLNRALQLRSQHLITEWMIKSELGGVFSKLMDIRFDNIPAGALKPASELANSLLWYLYGLLQRQTQDNEGPYPYLLQHPQPLASPDNSTLAANQPRMPWHDVHCRIEGPSVYDLSRNFIDRWNGQQAYLVDTPPPQDSRVIRRMLETLMTWVNRILEKARLENYLQFDIRLDLKHPEPAWIHAAPLLPVYPPMQPGGVAIQVLRSAANNMLLQEQRGRAAAGVSLDALPGFASTGVQANCRSAMLQAISSAQHFIYIESQFFQSDFGAEGELNPLLPLSGPMSRLRTADHLPRDLVERVNLREALEKEDIWLLNWGEVDAIARNPDPVCEAFLAELRSITALNAKGWASQRLGQEQQGIINDIGAALADRIGRAIDEGRPFHVYMVLPVHPEGPLNEPTIMHQVHLTMQSLAFGEKSLIKRIQRYMATRAFMDRGDSLEEAEQRLNNLDSTGRPVYEQQDWSQYLTLLNLRTWDELDGQVVTEQIYVHSKLLIADDRIAILGSANINDRSLLGPRDSELAVIVRDGTPVSVALDGKCEQQVSNAVHELRINLWKKHFGLNLVGKSKVSAANELGAHLTTPAAETTWKAIQLRAENNTRGYVQIFSFIPQNMSQNQVVPDSLRRLYPNGFPASIWPAWTYNNLINMRPGGRLATPMPFEESFWRSSHARPPVGIAGFICQLPTRWTSGENNNSGINSTIVAKKDALDGTRGRYSVHADAQSPTEDSFS